jgi:hypothetical protein
LFSKIFFNNFSYVEKLLYAYFTVHDPMMAVKEEGWSGLGKGVASGVTGLVTKPTAGAFSMISKTAEGITATATAETKRTQRIRLPRYIGPDKVRIKNNDR